MTGPNFISTSTVLLLLVVTACSGLKDESESLPPQSVSQATLDDSEFEEFVVTQEDESVDEAPAADEAPVAAVVTEELDQPVTDDVVVADDLIVEQDDTLVVIEDEAADTPEHEMTLVESARAERERRNTTPKTEIVITDKNLSDYAGAQLTISEGPARVITNENLGSSGVDEDELALDEAYWRDRGLEIRLAWKEASEMVDELEADVFNLRMRFYAEDDPFYRDAQIKPAWDHAIEELNATREEVDLRKLELQDFMEEGRVAGALPGWLREGLELEPVEPVKEEMGIAEPGEPDTMDGTIEDPIIAPDPGEGGQ
ncbi:MAG: hypothetical protein WBO69_08600 [Thermoanaerobaculia bacterium]